ncbi:MAG: DNA methyltransferase [Chitinophagales bacterium]
MPLSWNEIKSRAILFSKEWEGESRERAEKDSFWNDFFNVFGISRKRVASFEKAVKKLGNKQGYIDLFWKGTLLIEHKSRGKDLDKAFEQALDYFPGLKEHELPKYILVSDFYDFQLYDLEENTEQHFTLPEFLQHIHLFGFIAGYEKRTYKEEDPVNINAAELMGKLHDSLKEVGYTGHALEVYLVRMLFCLFADDTGIFERGIFQEYLDNQTKEDGSDLAMHLGQLFQVLNTSRNNRLRNLDESLQEFPYVNGHLFAEQLPFAAFDSQMRTMLLEACALDWGKISPAIFGSMFQAAMNPKERRNLGAHYTSEKNIQKLIQPLFLDELQEEFEKAKGNKRKLQNLQKKLASLKFLDPACGCGNFLIVTYRELRELELKILKLLYQNQQVIDIGAIVNVDVDQFYGIEYDEFPARIAEVAMWLMDHQMNTKVSEAFGQYFVRLPLKKSATIVHGNALRLEWETIVPKEELSYILGNPPFLGKKEQSSEQKEEMRSVFNKMKGANNLDYVSAWYLKASQFIQNKQIKVGFVSTNSITQGEQVGILWNELLNKYRIDIFFAHRTFRWDNEAKGKAAVHVIIIGFASFPSSSKVIFDYQDVKGEPNEIKAKNINPYLVDSNNTLILARTKPIGTNQGLTYGSFALDDGNYTISKTEYEEILQQEPESKIFFKPFIGGRELISNITRYCVWIDKSNIQAIRKSKIISEKVKKVKTWRSNSGRTNTKKMADFPTLFAEIRQPKNNYIAIPTVSSERRKYIPIAYLNKEIIASNQLYIIPEGTVFHFGILTSEMHMAWVKHTCGRLKSDYRYSKDIVYNNYPFPKNISDKNKTQVEKAAQKVLDVRAKYPDSSLADLYDPLTMPPDLVKAHQQLDKAVDLCYRPQAFVNERNRIEFLFELYEEYVKALK